MRLTAWTGSSLKEEMLESAILQLRAGAVITALSNFENQKLIISAIEIMSDNEGADIHISELLERVNGDNVIRDILILRGNWNRNVSKFVGWNILDTRTEQIVFDTLEYIDPYAIKDIVFEYLYENYCHIVQYGDAEYSETEEFIS